jgi:hypothetical protein
METPGQALLLDTAATVTSARLTLRDSESELIDAAIGPMMAVMMVVEGCLLLQGLYLTFGKSGRTHLNMWKVPSPRHKYPYRNTDLTDISLHF